MKKTIFGLFLLAMTAVLLQGQEVTIRDTTPFTYAYLECKGSYQQIPAKINEFMGEFFKQKLLPAGSFFAMYLNSPAQVKEEELQWRLAFPVAADAAVAAPLLKGECTATKIAVYLHVGPYEKLSEAYAKLAAFFEKQEYKPAGPCFEKYLDMNPQAVKPEELRTEINWPVEKK
jgi:AraC family transcriptional regulator